MEMKKEEFLYPEFEFLAKKDPEFYQRFISLARYPIEKGTFLDLKTKLVIPMIILAYRGEGYGVYKHIKRALELGMTVEQILEAFQVALLPGGASTLFYGLEALLKVEQESLIK